MAEPTAPISPLEMARNAARAVLHYADAQNSPDPDAQLQSYIRRDGAAGQQAAALAGQMALVSIAESLARVVELVERDMAPGE